MRNAPVPTQRAETTNRELDRLVSYDDGDGTVVCDRTNPAAWIRSTALRPVER